MSKIHPDQLRDLWTRFQSDHSEQGKPCSVDKMLCNPMLRNAWIKRHTAEFGLHPEQDVLWSVVSLRKKGSGKGGLRRGSVPDETGTKNHA